MGFLFFLFFFLFFYFLISFFLFVWVFSAVSSYPNRIFNFYTDLLRYGSGYLVIYGAFEGFKIGAFGCWTEDIPCLRSSIPL